MGIFNEFSLASSFLGTGIGKDFELFVMAGEDSEKSATIVEIFRLRQVGRREAKKQFPESKRASHLFNLFLKNLANTLFLEVDLERDSLRIWSWTPPPLPRSSLTKFVYEEFLETDGLIKGTFSYYSVVDMVDIFNPILKVLRTIDFFSQNSTYR